MLQSTGKVRSMAGAPQGEVGVIRFLPPRKIATSFDSSDETVLGACVFPGNAAIKHFRYPFMIM